MMWNLPYEGLKTMCDMLNCPLDADHVWRLTGGNTRALLELYQEGWDVERYYEIVKERIAPLLIDLLRDRLRRLVENPDSDAELARLLEKHGLMIGLLRGALVLGQELRPDPELGIGQYFAWFRMRWENTRGCAFIE